MLRPTRRCSRSTGASGTCRCTQSSSCAARSRAVDSDRLDLERRRDVDGRHQGPCNRAVLCVGTQDAFGRRAFVGVLELQVVGHVDALEDQDLVLFLDLALGDSDEPVTA